MFYGLLLSCLTLLFIVPLPFGEGSSLLHTSWLLQATFFLFPFSSQTVAQERPACFTLPPVLACLTCLTSLPFFSCLIGTTYLTGWPASPDRSSWAKSPTNLIHLFNCLLGILFTWVTLGLLPTQAGLASLPTCPCPFLPASPSRRMITPTHSGRQFSPLCSARCSSHGYSASRLSSFCSKSPLTSS